MSSPVLEICLIALNNIINNMWMHGVHWKAHLKKIWAEMVTE